MKLLDNNYSCIENIIISKVELSFSQELYDDLLDLALEWIPTTTETVKIDFTRVHHLLCTLQETDPYLEHHL